MMGRRFRQAVLLLLALLLAGCATARNPKDPLEGFNRAMFSFNDKVDTVALKPAARVYRSVLPSFVQTGVGNFFGNLADIPTMANNLLQGKIEDGLNDFMRVAVNSTFGIAGVLDIASEAGIPKHREDFGQTLGRWGVPPGPYVVLPVFGPSTLRDSAALPIDLHYDPWFYTRPVSARNTGTILRLVDQRAALLDATNLVEEAALDRYEFVRDAYLQRRESTVHDGDVPVNRSSDDVPPTNDADDKPGAQAQPDAGAAKEPGAAPVVNGTQPPPAAPANANALPTDTTSAAQPSSNAPVGR